MIKIRQRDDLKNLKKDPKVKEVYLGRRLSKNVATLLLSLYPNLEKIYLPRSLYRVTSNQVKKALEAVGVRLVPTDRRPGRPPKYDEETLKLIVEKYKSGEAVNKISSDTGIPLRTVYYLLRKLGLRR